MASQFDIQQNIYDYVVHVVYVHVYLISCVLCSTGLAFSGSLILDLYVIFSVPCVFVA